MQNRTRLCFPRRRPWLANPEEFARNLDIDISTSVRRTSRQCRSRGTTLSSYADHSTSVRFLWETPNGTINCPRRKLFGIEKVSAKLPCHPSTDIQISVGHAGRIPIGLSTKRAFHSALKKNTSNTKSVDVGNSRDIHCASLLLDLIKLDGIGKSRENYCD